MHKLTKAGLEQLLTRRLRLRDPLFHLSISAGRLSGSVVSTSFARMNDDRRQQAIWDALEADLGAEAVRRVGMLLAYTPEEWQPESILAESNGTGASRK